METGLPPARHQFRTPFVLRRACLITPWFGAIEAYAAVDASGALGGSASLGSGIAFATMGLTVGVLVALTLSVISLFRTKPNESPLIPAISVEELREMRQAVSSFATLLRDGSAVLIKTNAGTLETTRMLGACSQELLARVADTEGRLQDATARSEVLATRVARSAAAEIKLVVSELSELTERLQSSLPPREGTLPHETPAAGTEWSAPAADRQKGVGP